MQASQLKTLIKHYGAALAISGANDAVSRVTSLAETIGKGGSQTVAKFLGAVEKAVVEPISGTASHLGELVAPIEKLIALLTEAGAKKSAIADLQLLLDLLRRRSELSLAEFESRASFCVASASRRRAGASPVGTKPLVENYLQKLEAALGNDVVFRDVYRELCLDEDITKVEAIEIASRFFEPMARSATRPKALQKILQRHEKLLDSRRASKSIGGHRAA